jgi:hypothetical protein
MAPSDETVMLGVVDECAKSLSAKEEVCFIGQPCF